MRLSGQGAGVAGLVMQDGLIPALPAFTRDAALLALARLAAERLGLSAPLVHERLRTREALGSTAFGGGAAIPHARVAGLAACAVMVARLPQPVDWQATDGQPVDMLLLLLSPEDAGADHLKALARISRALRDGHTLPALRAAADEGAMAAALAGELAGGMAAVG